MQLFFGVQQTTKLMGRKRPGRSRNAEDETLNQIAKEVGKLCGITLRSNMISNELNQTNNSIDSISCAEAL